MRTRVFAAAGLMAIPIFLGFSAPQCNRELAGDQSDILHSLFELEQNFVQMKWQFHKYREAVYRPLWEARFKSEDPFSLEREAEGKLLYGRYRHLADSLLSLADEAEGKMFDEVDKIRASLTKVTEACKSGEFQNCLGPWWIDLQERLNAFQIFLKKYGLQERKLSDRVEQTIKENPSEHHDFGERYYEFYTEWAVKVYPEFLKQIRIIREKIELDWPNQKCCAVCEPRGQEFSKDTVLSQVSPDREGARGVEGQVVKQKGVTQAFDELEEK